MKFLIIQPDLEADWSVEARDQAHAERIITAFRKWAGGFDKESSTPRRAQYIKAAMSRLGISMQQRLS